ncbi:hypothetical protein CEUSTIGMA_g7262.t1 [Chlamydomonas eustigma]|uniref:EXPERA domain-containing protein n=1 Tax=Chlamydomonas eustigma TaxID=1157962 RepID=A0A250XAD2_9CHLO|nr:hypothetical protein CEUSTIGMA_g7262.t1 [Chlamydomonas eustigma]|eukprot:GAX79822.1 hypothetical protein CEUSTIGMA_g7262.t1 [Chlamydomonas eustigma]
MKKVSEVPIWIKFWMGISGFVVLYDAGYVLMRPRSMPGGDLFSIWSPYELYARVDKLYSREAMLAGDGFNKAQSILNLAEVSLHFLSLYLWSKPRLQSQGDVLAFGSQLMTLWKTVLYWLNDFCRPEGQRYTEGSDLMTWLLVYMLPNVVWLIVPSFTVYALGQRLISKMPKTTSKR